MVTISRTPPDVMRERWTTFRAESVAGSAEGPPPRSQNVRAILDLGELIFFTFRGRGYGVPPLPWKEGERLLDVWLQIRAFGDEIDEEKVDDYFSALRRLARILWRNTRPPGPWLRLLKLLGILRNPYLRANERELAEAAVFFLGLRTRSTASFKPGPDALPT